MPLLDLANHRAHGDDVEPPLVQTGDGMTVLCACTDLDKGDEVTFQYAKEGNGRLLLDYGFAELHGEGDEGKGGEGGNDGGNGSEFVDLEQLDARLEAEPIETARRLQLVTT